MSAASGKESASSSSTPRTRRRRLGKGLESLMGKMVEVTINEPDGTEAAAGSVSIGSHPSGESDTSPSSDQPDGLHFIPIESIRPGPHQPRHRFDEATLKSLAESIRSAGVMQPVVLRPVGMREYELVAGERRWRAAGMIGLAAIPAVIREMDAQTAAELALVENLQREDLNPIERAEAFRNLAEEFGLTHEAIADRVGLKRASITNHLRLLELDDPTREALEEGRLTLGHAKALLALANISDRQALARRAIARSWSVRDLERRIRQADDNGETSSAGAQSRSLPPHLEDLQMRLGAHLGTRVRIVTGRKKGAGRLIIEFYSLDEFQGLLERFRFNPE